MDLRGRTSCVRERLVTQIKENPLCCAVALNYKAYIMETAEPNPSLFCNLALLIFLFVHLEPCVLQDDQDDQVGLPWMCFGSMHRTLHEYFSSRKKKKARPRDYMIWPIHSRRAAKSRAILSHVAINRFSVLSPLILNA